MRTFMRSFLADQSGATAIEYGLIAGIIGLVLVTALSTIGTTIRGTFNNVANGVK